MVKAMEMAQQEFKRAVAAGMGIYLIAEAFGIKPIQVVRHGDGYGLLTEKYVVVEIARQIEEMGIAKEEAEQCVVCGAKHEIMWGTWVISGAGKLLCANDKCWRKAVEEEKGLTK